MGSFQDLLEPQSPLLEPLLLFTIVHGLLDSPGHDSSHGKKTPGRSRAALPQSVATPIGLEPST